MKAIRGAVYGSAAIALAVAGCSEAPPADEAPGGGSGGTGGLVAPPPETGGASPAGGSPSGGAPTLAGPIERGELLVLEFEGRKLTLDPKEGARITSLTFEGMEILTQQSDHDENFGSTLWTSPQSDWSWPPPEALDRGEYLASVGESSVTLESGESEVQGSRVVARKEFAVDFATAAFVLRYGLENVGDESISVAPWEVTRVRPNGLTFFRAGAREVKSPDLDLLALDTRAGTSFFDHEAWGRGASQKVNADALEGFVAHAASGVLLVKSWLDVPAAAQHPEEGEVAIFASASGDYVEVENQGPLVELAPGAELSYVVRWALTPIPASVAVGLDRESLVTLAREALAP